MGTAENGRLTGQRRRRTAGIPSAHCHFFCCRVAEGEEKHFATRPRKPPKACRGPRNGRPPMKMLGGILLGSATVVGRRQALPLLCCWLQGGRPRECTAHALLLFRRRAAGRNALRRYATTPRGSSAAEERQGEGGSRPSRATTAAAESVPTLLDRLREGGVGLRFEGARSLSGSRPFDGWEAYRATLSPSATSKRDTIVHWGGVAGNGTGAPSFLYAVLDDGEDLSGGSGEGDDYQRSVWIRLGPTGRLLGETDHRLADPATARWVLEFRHPTTRRRTRLYCHDDANDSGAGATLQFCLSRGQLADELRSLKGGGGGDGSRAAVGDGPGSLPLDPAVVRLLSGLREPSWRDALRDAVATDSFVALARFLEDERRQNQEVYPAQSQIFEALNLCPVESVRVVLVGQDPYHGPGQAHGLAFSVPKGVPPPPSLRNVLRELHDDLGPTAASPLHGCLEGWARQGVLLLNDVLTVRRGAAHSHASKGWEEFTDAALNVLLHKRSEKPVVWLLWGKPAQKKAGRVMIDDDETHRHEVIRTSHPSPLGATKTDSPFLGSRCFSRANAALVRFGGDPIDWARR